MPSPFLLDTNAYYLLFKMPREEPYYNLLNKIQSGPQISFFLPAIAAMEIYSVVGKIRRGCPKHIQRCDRTDHLPQAGPCTHEYVFPEIKKMNINLYKAVLKLLKEIHSGVGAFQAEILPINEEVVAVAVDLLIKYSDRYNFRSQDALIAATAIHAGQYKGYDLTLVTSDRILKRVANIVGVGTYDPCSDEWGGQ